MLNLCIPRPGRLDLGRSAAPGNVLTLSGVLPGVSGLVSLRSGHARRLDAGIPLRHRREGHVARSQPHSSALHCTAARVMATQAGRSQTQAVGARTAAGQPAMRTDSALSAAAELMHQHTGLAVQQGTPYQQALSAAQDTPVREHAAPSTASSSGAHALHATSVAQDGTRLALRVDVLPVSSLRALWAQPATAAEQAMPPPHGWRINPYPPPPPTRHRGRLALLCPRPGRLNIGARCWGSAALRVAIRRSYRVTNTASLVRDSDGADIACSSITLRLDNEAWSWSLSASLLGSEAMERVPVPPAAVRVAVNGYEWRMVVDDISFSRSFGAHGASISGRSLAARLADPYARARDYSETQIRTAQQLALQELPAGWTLDWQITDWTVPARTFRYTGLTPLESIKRVVKAAGGWLYADRFAQTLHAVPKWPQKPWAWDFVPDMSLPSSYALKETRQAQLGTAYDAIMVCGGINNGLAVLVTRAGQPGSDPAASVTDSLITDLEPAKARAVQELADGWPLRQYSISLPLQAPPAGAGLIMPGTTLDFVDGADGWRGLVVGTSVSVSSIDVTQDLEIISP